MSQGAVTFLYTGDANSGKISTFTRRGSVGRWQTVTVMISVTFCQVLLLKKYIFNCTSERSMVILKIQLLHSSVRI